MLTIAHIINPVKVGTASDLYHAQPITFETMRQAKTFAEGVVKVELYTTQYAEDHEIIPDFFKKTPDLKRSVLEVGTFDKKRKLPLIKDILDQLYAASQADYFVYTNVDIAVMPQFYVALHAFIEQGHDAFIINRRRVSARYTKVEEIPLIISDVGYPHPGFDCFVFHRDLYLQFVIENICVGIPFIGICLAHNLFCFGKNFKLYHDQHLTIHIGMEVIKRWGDKQYVGHNKREFAKVKKALMPQFDLSKFPYAHLPWYKRYASWLLNPAMQIGIAAPLEVKGWKEKLRGRFHELVFIFVWDWH